MGLYKIAMFNKSAEEYYTQVPKTEQTLPEDIEDEIVADANNAEAVEAADTDLEKKAEWYNPATWFSDDKEENPYITWQRQNTPYTHAYEEDILNRARSSYKNLTGKDFPEDGNIGRDYMFESNIPTYRRFINTVKDTFSGDNGWSNQNSRRIRDVSTAEPILERRAQESAAFNKNPQGYAQAYANTANPAKSTVKSPAANTQPAVQQTKPITKQPVQQPIQQQQAPVQQHQQQAPQQQLKSLNAPAQQTAKPAAQPAIQPKQPQTPQAPAATTAPAAAKVDWQSKLDSMNSTENLNKQFKTYKDVLPAPSEPQTQRNNIPARNPPANPIGNNAELYQGGNKAVEDNLKWARDNGMRTKMSNSGKVLVRMDSGAWVPLTTKNRDRLIGGSAVAQPSSPVNFNAIQRSNQNFNRQNELNEIRSKERRIFANQRARNNRARYNTSSQRISL